MTNLRMRMTNLRMRMANLRMRMANLRMRMANLRMTKACMLVESGRQTPAAEQQTLSTCNCKWIGMVIMIFIMMMIFVVTPMMTAMMMNLVINWSIHGRFFRQPETKSLEVMTMGGIKFGPNSFHRLSYDNN